MTSKRLNNTADVTLGPVGELVARFNKPEFRASLTPIRGVTAMDADSREELVEWSQALRRWLDAQSFRDGFPELLGRRSRLERIAERLLADAAPEQLAAVMNKCRPSQYIRRRVTAEAAACMEGTMSASELADLIEVALEYGRPNEAGKNGRGAAGWTGALDALRQVEVEGYKPPEITDDDAPEAKDDPIVRGALRARRLLGQARKRGRRVGFKAKKRER